MQHMIKPNVDLTASTQSCITMNEELSHALPVTNISHQPDLFSTQEQAEKSSLTPHNHHFLEVIKDCDVVGLNPLDWPGEHQSETIMYQQLD